MSNELAYRAEYQLRQLCSQRPIALKRPCKFQNAEMGTPQTNIQAGIR